MGFHADANSTAKTRRGWDEYFIAIAVDVATRATCDRLHVGCVLVEPETKAIIATGYNGSVRGQPHCDDEGHLMEDGHCVRTLHAETNAITQAARRGARIEGATAYITAYPCWGCTKQLLNAGVKRIVFGTRYRMDTKVEEACAAAGCKLEAASSEDGATQG